MYLISAYFDEHSGRTLQRYIDRIAEKTGNVFMTEHHVPPHLTISSIEARSVDVLRPAFLQLEHEVKKGEIELVTIGQLLPYVFYTAPVMNEYLFCLSEQVYHQFQEIPETKVSRYYRPMSWFPHITLGKTLTKPQMETAFSVMQERFQPMKVTITELGLAKVNPHEDVVRFGIF